MLEVVRPKATWEVVLRKPDGRAVFRLVDTNVLTTKAKEAFARAFATGTYRQNLTWYLVLGTGTGTPAETDTNLFSPDPTTPKTGDLTYSGNQVVFSVRYWPDEANGTWTEAGIFDECTAGDYTTGFLLNHAVFSQTIEKTSDLILDVTVTITF